MKRILIALTLTPFLYGCSVPPPTTQQQQRVFDNEVHNTDAGEKWSVKSLQENYKKITGDVLVAPDTSSCKWDGDCYYNAWSKVHDKGLRDFNSIKAEERNKEESKCLADKECVRKRSLDKAMKDLSWAYTMVLAINPYSQADADAVVRGVCDKSTDAQKQGMTQTNLVNRMRDFPGLAPREREYLSQVVKSCWSISSLGGDWREPLRNL